MVSFVATCALAAGACQARRSQTSDMPRGAEASPAPTSSPAQVSSSGSASDQAPSGNQRHAPGKANAEDSSSERKGASLAASDGGQCGEEVSRQELLAPAHGLVKHGAPGWEYSARLRADVDGDGVEETLWVIAQAELYKGRLAWDDGQEWQVYVEEDSGETTHVFARYVQLAQLEVALTMDEPRELLVNATGPSTAEYYRLRYRGPGQFSGRRIVQEGFIAWPEPALPGEGMDAER